MPDLKKIRIQVIDQETGAVVENVDVKSSDNAVYLQDGTTLRNWINNTDVEFSKVKENLTKHLNKKHVAPEKVDSIITGLGFDSASGNFTLTKHDGSTETLATKIDEIPVGYALITGEGVDGKTADDLLLEVTLDNSNKLYADLTLLNNLYEGSEGNGVKVEVDGNTIKASLEDNAVTTAKIADGAVTRAKIDEAFEKNISDLETAVENLETESAVTVEKLAVADEGAIASYIVKQNGQQVGDKINIPKDYLVKSAELKSTQTEIKVGDNVVVAAGHKYIDFVVNTVGTDGNESHIYLDINELIDVYKAAEGATEVQLALDSVTNTFSATLVDGGVSTAKLADKAVTTGKIADEAVTATQLATDAVETTKIKDGAVTEAKLAADTVTTDKIKDGAVTRVKIDAAFEEDIADLEDGLDNKIQLDEKAIDIKLTSVTAQNVVIGIAVPDTDVLSTAVGTPVAAQTVAATKTGAKADAATLTYQWYKKVVGTDVAFVVMEGCTAATLPAEKIDVSVAGTSMYYCVVNATGDEVITEPVASQKITVIVA